MYKITIIVAVFVICQVRSAPEVLPSVVPIIHENFDLNPDGKFQYSFETGDGIKAHEEGDLKQVDKELVETVSGGWEYTAPGGESIVMSYVADETGYHPVGDSIPVAPPIPGPIVKLLQFIEAHPELQLKTGEAVTK